MSSARRIRDAINRHQDALQRAVDCLSPAVVIVRGRAQRNSRIRHVEAPITYVIANGDRVPLAVSPTLYVEAAWDCHVARYADGSDWMIVPDGYMFVLSEEDGTEVVAYHWHPESTPSMAEPHIHFGPALARHDATRRAGDLHRVHFRTGIVSLTDVIRLVIEEFHVEPRRADWDAVLRGPS